MCNIAELIDLDNTTYNADALYGAVLTPLDDNTFVLDVNKECLTIGLPAC